MTVAQPQRIRLSRARGFRLPANAVVVARPSRLGNPFVVGKHGTRAQCAGKFYALASGFISLGEGIEPDAQLKLQRHICRVLPELRGKDLACWCALDGGACHGDVLLWLANPEFPVPTWAIGGIDTGKPRVGMAASDLEKLKLAKARRSDQ